MTQVRRAYADGRYGQIHYWEAGTPGGQTDALPDLYCLHATAYSGQTFLPLMRRLAVNRRVIAIDTPGYGASDAPPGQVPFEDYALAIFEAIHRIHSAHARTRGHTGHAVDVLGYHTGAMLAVEIAAAAPDLIRRAVLMGIPFFTGDDKLRWRDKLVHVTELSESLAQFQARWDYFITHRSSGLLLERAFACFVDELRAYPRDWWAHHALFDYDAEKRLPGVSAPVLVLNHSSSLAEASRAAARRMPHAVVQEVPEIGGAPFDLSTGLLTRHVAAFLDAPQVPECSGAEPASSAASHR